MIVDANGIAAIFHAGTDFVDDILGAIAMLKRQVSKVITKMHN